MALVEIQVTGLREFAREAKKVDRKLGKELRQAHLKVAKLVLDRTHDSMRSGGRQSAKARKGVKAKATQRLAAINTTPGPGWTLSVIWGQKRRSGWYAAGRYRNSDGRQFPKWAGNQWTPGETGGVPYHLGPAMNSSIDEAIELFGEALDTIAREAGFT